MTGKMLAAGTALALTLSFSGLAVAGCTPEEAQQKAIAFSQAAQECAQKDAAKYAKIMQELQPELVQIQQTQDVEAMCAFYDKALERLK